jgi:hypothetical protein
MTSHSRRANWLTVYIFSNLGFATSRPTCARSANPNVSDATPPNAQLRAPQAQRIICAFSRSSAYLRAVWKSYTGTHAPRRLISATMLARGADGAREARVEVAHSYSLASFQFRNITHEIEASDCARTRSSLIFRPGTRIACRKSQAELS